MIRKFLVGLLISCIMILFLTGCWDRKELNQLGIVMAMGFDRDSQTGKILLTSQVVRPGALEKKGGASKEPTYDLAVTSGFTIFEAARNTVKEFDRRSFFSHVKVILVGETLASEGLKDVIDFVSRTHEIRKNTWLIVANGSEAREMLGIKHGIENVQANYMQGIIKRQSINSDVTTSSVIDFIQKMSGEGINPITGVFKMIHPESIPTEGKEPETRKGLSLTGSAVFKKDKLIGFLNEEETRGLNLITGNKNNAAIHVSSPADEKKEIAIEVKKIDSNISSSIEGGKMVFHIKVKGQGNIIEVQDDYDVSDPEQFDKVNDQFTEFIYNNVKLTADKVQKELQVDILGFGEAYQKKHPKDWENIKKQWDTLFPKVAYDIQVETRLIRTGLLLKSIHAKKADK